MAMIAIITDTGLPHWIQIARQLPGRHDDLGSPLQRARNTESNINGKGRRGVDGFLRGDGLR